MTPEELRRDVAEGGIDTVLMVMTDMQGRLMGKRVHAPHFVEELLEHGAEGCDYLLAVDVDMTPIQGFAHASWETGYGDFVFRPDTATLRRVPWLERTALVVCDLVWHDGSPVAVSPRQVLRRQLERLAERGWSAYAASELEFLLFRDSYEAARDKGYRGLVPANAYNVDYSIFGTTVVEEVLRPLRLGMAGAEIVVENSKGECNFGQHEVNFRYADALSAADQHAIYKNGAKEIAWQHGHAISFMAKWNEREGNSCHIHLSVREGGRPLFAAEGGGRSQVFDAFLAGQLARTAELALFVAPNVNSYKRFARGSFAPTALVWGIDNRTCAFRAVGHGAATRIESRLPGADVNPYLAYAAMIAAGLDGVERGLSAGEPFRGSAYEAPDAPRVPSSLHDAIRLLEKSAFAREALGDEVVEHYLHAARAEQDLFDSTVTDWERERGFERL